MPRLSDIPYREDSAELYPVLAGRSWAVFLDSGPPHGRRGRFDILAADPFLTLVSRGGQTELNGDDGLCVSTEDPFDLLRRVLGPRCARVAGLPFCGGALGWLGYDLGRRIERLPSLVADAEGLPDLAIGLYDWALVVDHRRRRSVLVGQGRDPRTAGRWSELTRAFSDPPPMPTLATFRVTGAVRSNLGPDGYAAAYRRVQRYIRDGDCYQVNLAQRFAASAEGHAWPAYRELRRASPAPFGAFLDTPFGQVLSASPERFLRLRGCRVQTRPIKGTRPRGATPEADAALAAELAASPKDRAENLMIVDLLRNDLGRVCRPGSVRVPSLFAVESFATVHHLVSTVQGRLARGQDAPGLLRACFPGGSITGAPKVRAMQIIEELEPNRRGVYCGSIGYLGFDGSLDCNVAIRTLVHGRGEVRCWGGGGIVHDSQLEAEYQETLHKAAAMLRLLDAASGDRRGAPGRGFAGCRRERSPDGTLHAVARSTG